MTWIAWLLVGSVSYMYFLAPGTPVSVLAAAATCYSRPPVWAFGGMVSTWTWEMETGEWRMDEQHAPEVGHIGIQYVAHLANDDALWGRSNQNCIVSLLGNIAPFSYSHL
jgi:hypothetical protein